MHNENIMSPWSIDPYIRFIAPCLERKMNRRVKEPKEF